MMAERSEDLDQAMRSYLARARPDSPAVALERLRAAFPEVALADRVRSLADWRRRNAQAA